MSKCSHLLGGNGSSGLSINVRMAFKIAKSLASGIESRKQ
jgi:hypothetical protein